MLFSVPVEDDSLRTNKQGTPKPIHNQGTTNPAPDHKTSNSSTTEGIHSAAAESTVSQSPIEVDGFAHSPLRDCIYWLFGCLTLGLSLLVGSWFSVTTMKLRKRHCPIHDADCVLVKTRAGQQSIHPLRRQEVLQSDLRLAVCRRQPEETEGERFADTNPASSQSSESMHTNNTPLISPSNIEDQGDLTTILEFDFHCVHFILNPWNRVFVNAEFQVDDLPFSELWKSAGDLKDDRTVESRRSLFGSCLVNVPLKSSLELVVTECLHPFYIFQLCSLLLWFLDHYYYYASAVLLLSSLSLFISIRETLKNNRNLHNMAKFSCDVSVLRLPYAGTFPPSAETPDSPFVPMSSIDLVPGDVMIVERGMKLPCDALLLTGSVLVDESMMTGESKPVYKSELPTYRDDDKPFHTQTHAKHVLYGGSEIKDTQHTNSVCLCLVVKTGFASEQGRMMRSLVCPEILARMNFERETWKFVGLLACMSLFTFCWTLYQSIQQELSTLSMIKRSLDTVTIAVPPALPIIISVGVICAQYALKAKSGTTCLMPSRINVAGRATVMVFDKTGTLTEDDEDLIAVIPSSTEELFDEHLGLSHKTISEHYGSEALMDRFPKGLSILSTPSPDVPGVHFGTAVTIANELSPALVTALACCHSLSFVDDELIGDPLEFQMFTFSGWVLTPPQQVPQKLSNTPDAAVGENSGGSHILVSPEAYFSERIEIDVSGSPDPADNDVESGIFESSDFRPQTSHAVASTPQEGFIDFQAPPCKEAYEILKVFEFDSRLQRMSVIVRAVHSGETKVYCKGSPEKIGSLCSPNSRPHDWDSVLSDHTERGLRVLAIAEKSLGFEVNVSKIERHEIESNLYFLGLLVFSNLLRPSSASVISELVESGCCVYMATGDAAVTGAAIGFQAGLLPAGMDELVSGTLHKEQVLWKLKKFKGLESLESLEGGSQTGHSVQESHNLMDLIGNKCLSKVGLAITGEAFRHIVLTPDPKIIEENFEINSFTRKPTKSWKRWGSKSSSKSSCVDTRNINTRPMNLQEFILRYFQVFSRMSPDDKALLIHQLQGLPNKPIVGMCGDGANDCSALKAADVGISLSCREASVAAPFNSSTNKSITVVLDVLKEGRGALTNSIQNFQFVALYAMIQLCAVTLLSHYGCSLADAQFLYMDLIVVLPLTYFMAWSRSSEKLSRALPPQTLLAWSIIASLVGQTLIQVAFQIASMFFVLPVVGQYFYQRFEVNKEEEDNFDSYENTVAFLVSNTQTVVIAIILAFGTRPWKVVNRNFGFLLVSAIFTIIAFALILNEAPYMAWLRNLLHLAPLPLAFRTFVLLTVSINVLCSAVLEEAVVRATIRRLETRQDQRMLNRESLRGKAVDELVLCRPDAVAALDR